MVLAQQYFHLPVLKYNKLNGNFSQYYFEINFHT